MAEKKLFVFKNHLKLSTGNEFQTVGWHDKNSTAIRAKSAARNCETISGLTKTARSSVRGWDVVISEVPRRLVMQTQVPHHTKLVLNPLRDIQPAELVMEYCLGVKCHERLNCMLQSYYHLVFGCDVLSRF